MFFILKLVAGAYFVSMNIFTFLLIKFQKNDRDIDLLSSVAVGKPEDVEYNNPPKPQKQEMQTARSVLICEEEDIKPPSEEKQYSHVFDEDKKDEGLASDTQEDDTKANGQNGNGSPQNEQPEIVVCEDKKKQKKQKEKLVQKYGKKPISDIKLLLCAVLGGALGIYAALFVFKYRLRDLVMMVVVPTILVINAYIMISIFTIWLIAPETAERVFAAMQAVRLF